MNTILIIEDDPAILKGLEVSLTEEHYKVISASDGEIGFQKARREKADLIILDVMLPNKNGNDICADLRKEGITTPILMLTSKKQEIDKVIGLEIGADDYVTKPFSVRELLARIKALLRRTSQHIASTLPTQFGDVTINFEKQEAYKKKNKITMSAKEFQLLKYFLEHEGVVISRSTLLDDVWGYDVTPTTRTVDNYILSLRKKIETKPSNPQHLLTIHTAGYKFVK